jgi:hypothetical protein
MLGKFIAGDFIAIAGEMRRFTASNENTDILMSVLDLYKLIVYSDVVYTDLGLASEYTIGLYRSRTDIRIYNKFI